MNNHYIIDGQGNPVHEPSRAKRIAWAKSPAAEQFRVGDEYANGHDISTIFLDMDVEGEEGVLSEDPIVWETLVHGPNEEVAWQDRCGGNRTNAVAMHARAVAKAKALIVRRPRS